MNTTLLVSLFSPGQITGIVLMSVLILALIGLNVYLAYLIHKRGVHKLHTMQLQKQREALMEKLDAMRSGKPFEFTPRAEAEEEDELEEEEESLEEADDDLEEEPDDEDDSDEDEVVVAAEKEESEEIAEIDEEPIEAEVDEATGAVVRYNRSFTARITQADNDLKARYSELKNYLLSYGGIGARMSWKRETFHLGKRKSVACFVVRGKTLCMCLATEPRLFEGTKYKVEDVAGDKKKNTMPTMFRITSDRKMGYAKELVDIVMAGFSVSRSEDYKAQDFTLPYKTTQVLVKRHLIKIVGNSVPEYEKESAMAAAKGVRYNRSFQARIIQSDDALKARYSRLKNYLLAHDRVVCVDSWKRETFRRGRSCVAALAIRGKTLCLCLAADPKAFEGSKYKVEDLSLQSKNINTPLQYRVKSDRRLVYAMQLIDRVFTEMSIAKVERQNVDYAVPFVATETLIRRGMIRVSQDAKTGGWNRAKDSLAEGTDASAQAEEVAAAAEPAPKLQDSEQNAFEQAAASASESGESAVSEENTAEKTE